MEILNSEWLTLWFAFVLPIRLLAIIGANVTFYTWLRSDIEKIEHRFDAQNLELRIKTYELRKESDRKWEETQKEIKEIKIGVARLEERK